MKRLQRHIKDLDDVREHMAVLSELREAEGHLQETISPIVDAYVLLSRFGLHFNDGNTERMELLSYTLSKLQAKASETSDQLLSLQPEFQTELVNGVRDFIEASENFTNDYDDR